ncbi:MAG: integrase arm-type DNA-binding domain-containing protein [Aestuariivirga sp.]
MGKLTARQVETLKLAGRHSDGGNLYLNISKSGAKSWVFFYRFGKAQKEMGLGGVATTSLAEARTKALAALKLLKDGRDPLVERRAAEKLGAGRITFGAFAEDYIKTHEGKHRNSKHAGQWRSTLGPNYCRAIRNLPVNEIDTEAVLKVLRPLWQKVPETAARIRGRIENVLDAAKAQGLFQGDNPARWKGHLKAVLPARQRLTRGHHAAIPYDDLPTFMRELRAIENSLAAKALEFCILTATRTNETLGIVWSEVDLAKRVWVIPAKRMKAGYEHRIPLSERAVEILKTMEPVRSAHSPYIFPGRATGKSLSHVSMAHVLKRMKRDTITVHGFRSTFRDWASEQTSSPHKVCEMALAHVIGNKAEAAYRRGDLFEKRRLLMDGWQAFADSKPLAKVLPLKR